MQKYIAIRVHTALYLSVFFLALHYVFVYFANSSILSYFFKLSLPQVLVVYVVASLASILIYLWIASRKILPTKTVIYIFILLEMLALALMYNAITYAHAALFVIAFGFHHLTTPYMLYNLDILFESYTHVEDRGKGRGIYMTMWNMPFIIVPLLLSSLSVEKLPIVYIISFLLLLPFIFFVYTYIQEPEKPHDQELIPSKTVWQRITHFWSDTLDRNSFLAQSTLHLYYGITGVFLPVYLHSYFGFEWDKIGMLLLISSTPFILFQIPFGSIEDKEHNEKKIFFWGIMITILFTILGLLVTPSMSYSFLFLALFIFLSKIGCSLIEIAMEGTFYKHVTERNAFALMSFRAGRLFPYILGILAVFWL